MSLFDKKAQLPRKEFREILKKSDIKVGTGKGFNIRERLRIEKDIFPEKHGGIMSKQIFDRGLNKLKKEGAWEADLIKKSKIHKKIKYLKKLEETGGIDKK
ncbi:MAG: hypothetical protein Q7S77_03060 [Candidatus Staskawiczbacteria bacterium]|nr:hypothetical protein [Candidatus Staskawiczbacteria bacterium]